MARLIEMSEDQYHADPCDRPSLSNSIAKIIVEETPLQAYLKHPKLGGKKQEGEEGKEEDVSKFDMGKAAHAYLLEGMNNIEIIYSNDWRTKNAKEARHHAQISGKFPLLMHQYDSVLKMTEVAKKYIANTPDFGMSLSDGYAEQTLIWGEDTPFPKRARLDWISKQGCTVLDYKTTNRGLRYDEIRRHIESMGYDMQAVFYSDGVRELKGKEPRFIFLFQSTEAPYICQMYSLDHGFMHLARAKVDYAIAMWKQCLTENYWPGSVNRILSLEPSSWSHANWDERMELEGMILEEIKPEDLPINKAMASKINYLDA
jgi:hypothetical protein